MSTRIADLPPTARPREKLLQRGPQALADAELVALLLRSGVRGCSALQLGQGLLDTFGGLHGLLHAPAARLRAVRGLGMAKYAELAAVLELARRALAEPLRERQVFDTPEAVSDYLRLWLAGSPVEIFAALLLDHRHRLLHAQELWRGTLSHTAVYPRELVKLALAHEAAAVIVAHNHPSGHAEPSDSDRQVTARLKGALGLLDIGLLDHLVVTRTRTFSFAREGLL
ncbi:MAG: DNA repair protein RadC [Betaproteobacteria bacterium]|nr:DNA repair protein RadC [Betaproteobacteria bacterium]